MTVIVAVSPDDAAEAAAQKVRELASEATSDRGRFTVALSGGSTPAALYKLLAEDPSGLKNTYYFFSDERNVPPDHADSNFDLARRTLLQPLGVPEERIERWPTGSAQVEDVARDYEERMRKVLGPEMQFDLVLLGLGDDGHTASLFPGSPALGVSERMATENYVESLGGYRFTLTFPVINRARTVIFFVTGEAKAAAVRDVVTGSEELPAARVAPLSGDLFWFLDRAAASLLPESNI